MRIKKQFIKLAIILSSIILIISSLNNIIISEDNDIVQNDLLNKNDEDNNLISPKSSGSWTLTSIYIDDSGGAGDGNWSWAEAQDWCVKVDGVYILENITLIGSFGIGIRIANSIESFRIKNCTILQKQTGIRFDSVSNGEIRNCYIKSSYLTWDSVGIYLQNSDNNNISDNIIEFILDGYFYFSSGLKGIRGYNSDNLDINGNVINGPSTGIDIYDSINSFLTDNTISSCVIGIGCGYVQHTEISFNQIFGEAWCGIELYDNNNNLTIEANFIVETDTGISIYETHNSLFKDNILIDNEEGFGTIWYYGGGPPCENNTYINNLIINSVKNEQFKDKSKTISSYDPSILYGVLIITSGLITIIILKKWKVLGKKK